MLGFLACQKAEEEPSEPNLKSSVASFTDTSANLVGEVVSFGNQTVTEIGICYGLTPKPTTGSFVVSRPAATGQFAVPITGLLPRTTYYVRSYARNFSTTWYSNETSFTTDLKVGSRYRGGVVFYLDAASSSGLVAAEPLTAQKWGCPGEDVSNTSVLLYQGFTNTSRIFSNCFDLQTAGRTCFDFAVNGFSDWYLPSRDELDAYRQSALGVSRAGRFWSSSQFDADKAWSVDFSAGISQPQSKADTLQVLPIRSF